MPKKSNIDKLTGTITIVKKMRDYSKDPAFVKKAEEATAFLKKTGIPDRFRKKNK